MRTLRLLAPAATAFASLMPILQPCLASTCPCNATAGYTTPTNNNSTSHTPQPVFTQLLETDFLHVLDLASVSSLWTPQAYNATPSASRGPYGKTAQVENVVTRPIASAWDWGSSAENPDPGLQLWVRREEVGDMVPMAEIVSVRDDILYGSFRIGMKGTRVAGTCAAFFFYFNDTQEIDVEFLSKETGVVNLIVQSVESRAVGYVASGSGDWKREELGWDVGDQYHEYRFDWLPESVAFYADSRLLGRITENVPDVPGRIHISHWSNGNEGWSGGPPEEDAVLTVSYVKAYFNSSDNALNTLGGEECEPCTIPDVKDPPDPTRSDGNQTAHTFFFGEDPSSRNSRTSSEANVPEESNAKAVHVTAFSPWLAILALIAAMS